MPEPRDDDRLDWPTPWLGVNIQNSAERLLQLGGWRPPDAAAREWKRSQIRMLIDKVRADPEAIEWLRKAAPDPEAYFKELLAEAEVGRAA